MFGRLGAEPAQTSGEPGTPTASWWSSTVSNIASKLGPLAAVAKPLIEQKLGQALTGKAKVPKPAAAPAAAGPPSPVVEKRGLPWWAIPAIIGGVVLLGGVTFLATRKKG